VIFADDGEARIRDHVAGRPVAALFAAAVKSGNGVASAQHVAVDGKRSVGLVEVVRRSAAVVVDLVPVFRFQRMQFDQQQKIRHLRRITACLHYALLENPA
jgi:hypothetical protein